MLAVAVPVERKVVYVLLAVSVSVEIKMVDMRPEAVILTALTLDVMTEP
jgi:hypothetical protein